jgi:HlyD family secretion protein
MLALGVCGCHGRVAANAPAPPRVGRATPASDAVPAPPLGPGYLGVVIGDVVDVAAPLDARVEALLVRVGDRVVRDQPLARLDRAALEKDLMMANAALAAARAARDKAALELRLARERAERRTGSVETSRGTVGLASDEERSTAQYEAELAAARLRAARAELDERSARVEQLRALAREAELRAPVDGVVAAQLVDAGTQAHRGAPILRLLCGGDARVRFAVPEADVGAVAVGDRLRVDAAGRSAGATVARVAPEINRSARMLFVEALLDSGAARLRVGEVARVRPGRSP